MCRAVGAAHLRDQPHVVDSGNRAIAVVFAAGECNLELARQVVKIRMPQQIARDAQSVRSDVKRFARANPGNGAGRHVAHRVAASLARGKARRGEAAHGGRHVFELHKVELNIFARGEMSASRRVIIRNPGKHAQMVRLQHARRDLHAQHLEPRLPLAICAVLQTEGPELLRGDLAALKLLDALFKALNLRLDGFGAVPFLDLRQDFHAHDSWLPTSLPAFKTPYSKNKKTHITRLSGMWASELCD